MKLVGKFYMVFIILSCNKAFYGSYRTIDRGFSSTVLTLNANGTFVQNTLSEACGNEYFVGTFKRYGNRIMLNLIYPRYLPFDRDTVFYQKCLTAKKTITLIPKGYAYSDEEDIIINDSAVRIETGKILVLDTTFCIKSLRGSYFFKGQGLRIDSTFSFGYNLYVYAYDPFVCYPYLYTNEFRIRKGRLESKNKMKLRKVK